MALQKKTPTGSSQVTELSQTFRERRRTLGLTQEELADLAEVSLRFVNSLEAGKTSVQLDKVLAVIDALGLELDVRLREVS